jgi:hypothetical protein
MYDDCAERVNVMVSRRRRYQKYPGDRGSYTSDRGKHPPRTGCPEA